MKLSLQSNANTLGDSPTNAFKAIIVKSLNI